MRKSLTYKIFAAVMAAGSLGLYVAAPAAAADDYTVKKDGEIISSGTFTNVYGNGHSFTIDGDAVIYGKVFGAGNSNYDKDASGGNVTISGNVEVTNVVCGGRSISGNAHHNTVNISGGSVVGSVGGSSGAVYGGRSTGGSAHHNTVNISDGSVRSNVYGGNSSLSAYNNIVNISGNADVTGGVRGGDSLSGQAHHNIVNISGDAKVTGEVSGGSSSSNANNNIVNISGGSVVGYVGSSIGAVSGGWSADGSAHHNIVNISGGIIGEANNIVDVYGGWSTSGSANGNKVIISGSADIENANLYGRNDLASGTGNTLTIDGWSDSTQSVQNFNDIAFKNIAWNEDEPVLTITKGNTGDLENTTIKTINIAGGSNINVGESMTLIESGNNTDLGLTEGNVTDTFTAGVAREGLGSTTIENGNVTFNINSVKLSSQAVSAAQTRAASAAFVNQGTDLISDSLDTISRNNNYGVKTFAAVHGNRSKYDIADDIKINGWSTIVGVGNADKFDNGSEFSWGVFYENGSGNYRTYNSFNNEFFRGDGSMVYNGGGIAARYENKNGVYIEGSLRAGMLKNELDNAMRNVNGSYGYETESAYYGAHIGVGKIISLSDSSDLDIYGKFFHTYTEGDSVTIAGDKFDFDSITSDRLRVGARITSNKENKFSTYYGLAYEYEFNGDADMTAQGLRADTQSLQGSSVMAEVGFNYQPTPDSPWSFDLNMRGYTGERQGGSFNVQATYTF